MNVSERTDDTLDRTDTLLKSLNSSTTNFLNSIMENYQNLFQNVNNDFGEVFTRTNQLTETIENSLISFKDVLDLSWQRLDTRTNNSAIKAFTALHHMTSELNSTVLTSMESALTDFFMPEIRNKNTPIRHDPQYPYPVFYHRDIPELQSPLLCDHR